MQYSYSKIFACIALAAAPGFSLLWAGEGKVIKIPMRSELTPVQRLNRDGVKAIEKHDYKNAEALFYKAYLYDPADPFTLNNLGYVSELEGDLDRASQFYQLASEQGSNASIDLSSAKHLEGKPMRDALINLQDAQIRVNRTNIQAMRMLAQNRGFDAIAVLKQILPIDPRNAFTLNNLGVASEATGDLDGALRYYRAAAALNSTEPATVTLDQSWRDKSVSEMAAASARRLERRIRNGGPVQAQAEMYTIHGVFELNQNDWASARKDFLRAYSLDPTSAFTLNNLGYVSEKDGDLESAQFYYEKAQRADNAGSRVGFASQLSAEGRSLNAVATDSNDKVDGALEIYSQQRRRQTGPVELTPRGDSGAIPNQPTETPKAAPSSSPSAAPQQPRQQAPQPH
ncbi:MAG TPA: tetratricopeptide repeat protein [Terracidiphilus sp.]|nr:tetratricopeptide repeat protein [Terracidiphilus sp.]